MKKEEVVNCETNKSGFKYPVYERPSEDRSVCQTSMPACSNPFICSMRTKRDRGLTTCRQATKNLAALLPGCL